MEGVTTLKWNESGLIPAVAQDRLTGQVRMVAWMNREALNATLSSGKATFYSRSRKSLWQKGETSGNALVVHEVSADCDGDTLLLLVDPQGPSCHTGRETCFFEPLGAAEARAGAPPEDAAAGAPHFATGSPAAAEGAPRALSTDSSSASAPRDAGPFLLLLEEEIRQRSHSSAEKSYTRSLLDGGVAKINGKILEEAGELCAALSGESDSRVASEAADVVYHLLVGLRARGIEWRSVMEVLAARAGRSGHAEKASRVR
jgi:phosphoribosyl-ATP pyrophosphohydrolase/phosphoribosyl-AMP cyclohydrolase